MPAGIRRNSNLAQSDIFVVIPLTVLTCATVFSTGAILVTRLNEEYELCSTSCETGAFCSDIGAWAIAEICAAIFNFFVIPLSVLFEGWPLLFPQILAVLAALVCFILGTFFMSTSECADPRARTLAVFIFVAQALATGLLLTIIYSKIRKQGDNRYPGLTTKGGATSPTKAPLNVCSEEAEHISTKRDSTQMHEKDELLQEQGQELLRAKARLERMSQFSEELLFQQMVGRLTESGVTALRSLGMEDFEFHGPQVVGIGTKGVVSEGKLKANSIFSTRAHIDLHRKLSQGIAIKMLFPKAVELQLSTQPRPRHHGLGNEYVTLLQNPHWGIANIFTLFYGPTQANLLSVDTTRQSHSLVPDCTEKPVDPQHERSASCTPLPEETVYIVQELGISNLVALEKVKLHPSRLLEVAFQLLSTVDFLNKRGVFHMDIKMSSILTMQRNGFDGQFVVLSGFEDAVFVDPSQPTGPGMAECNFPEGLAGNIINRAPEALTPQIVMSDNNSGATSVQRDFYNIAKTDVWAIGCVLWRLLCGAGVNLFQTKEEIRTKPIDLGYQLKSCPCMHTLIERILDREFATRPSAHAAAFVGAEIFLPDGIDGLCGSLLNQSKPEDWLQFQMHEEKKKLVNSVGPSAPTPVSTVLRAVFLKHTTPRLLLDSLHIFIPSLPLW
ncbi:hypothetical protein Pelo_16273 [Pelomyxa schiedti]|nr:hypothetical protein Pelo_16273 [Pelomyxa schiedti]